MIRHTLCNKIPTLLHAKFEGYPEPFFSNRYSMERGNWQSVTYDALFLGLLTPAMKDKLEASRETQLKYPQSS